jgi:hypothetical protein
MSVLDSPLSSSVSEQPEVGFLLLLPRLELHARIVFRHYLCPGRRDDAVQECRALAWKWYVRLSERGKDVRRFPMAFIFLVARAVQSGRRVCGQEKAKDVLSPRAQQRHDFAVGSLPSSFCTSLESLYAQPHGQETRDWFEEMLHDSRTTPPPDAAAFRVDFPRWHSRWGARDRRIINDLMVGERNLDVSKKYGLSPGRVSQKRRAYHRDWLRFHGEEASPRQRVGAA